MADDDHVAALGDRIDHGAGVRPPAGRLLLARKICAAARSGLIRVRLVNHPAAHWTYGQVFIRTAAI